MKKCSKSKKSIDNEKKCCKSIELNDRTETDEFGTGEFGTDEFEKDDEFEKTVEFENDDDWMKIDDDVVKKIGFCLILFEIGFFLMRFFFFVFR